MLSRLVSYPRSLTLQQYINGLLSIIGLAANLIALFSFFGAIQTSPTGSNFYVNSREYLAWFLVAFLYTFGMINAWIRRRWRRMYGHEKADNSVLNVF